MDNTFLIPDLLPNQKRRKKDKVNRLIQKMKWLDAHGRFWWDPDLKAFQADLFASCKIQPATINSILAAIRARYRELLNDPKTLHELSMVFGRDQVAIDHCLENMRKAADPNETKLSYVANPRFYRLLEPNQVSQFLNAPDIRTVRGLRDTTMIGTIIFTGLRESELCLLTVKDLHLAGGAGEIGIHVPEGAASTERFIPFYKEFPLQKILETWLSKAGIQEGPIFRGFFRNELRMRETAITIQAIEDIFRMYPIYGGDQAVQIKPSDLRIFYARMLYALDYSLDVISQNLGVQTQTAVNYIGTPMKTDEPIPAFDLKQL